jgi:thiol:disulfide interchange protein DsbC
MRKFIALIFISVMFGCSPSNDSEVTKNSTNSEVTKNSTNSEVTKNSTNVLYTIDDAKELFQEKYPNVKIDYIGMMNNNFFEIVVQDQIFYITPDLKNLLAGNIIDLDTGVNLTQNRISSFRMSIISQIDPSNAIINNIEVRYLLFSRNGKDDAAYDEMKYIWCSEDRKLSVEKAFNDQDLLENECENPLDINNIFARDLRVNGTPMIFTEKGDVIPGYVPNRQIIDLLNSYD